MVRKIEGSELLLKCYPFDYTPLTGGSRPGLKVYLCDSYRLPFKFEVHASNDDPETKKIMYDRCATLAIKLNGAYSVCYL